MRRRIVAILLVMFVVLNLWCVSRVYAANVCTIKANFSPSNPKAGDTVNIDVSAEEINEAIVGVAFSLDFNSNLLSITSVEAETGWTVTQTDTLITLFTDGLESTTQTGKICSIKLIVNGDADETSTTINLHNIEVTKEDASTVEIGDVTQDINITKASTDPEPTPEPDTNTNIDNETNTNVGNETNTNVDNETNTNVGNETNINTNNSNSNSNAGQITNISFNGKASDATTSKTESLPYTGKALIGVGAISIIIVAVMSYVKYNKYKNI